MLQGRRRCVLHRYGEDVQSLAVVREDSVHNMKQKRVLKPEDSQSQQKMFSKGDTYDQ